MVVLLVHKVRLEVLAAAVHKMRMEVLVILQQLILHKVIEAEITAVQAVVDAEAEVQEPLEEIHLVHLMVDQVLQIQ